MAEHGQASGVERIVDGTGGDTARDSTGEECMDERFEATRLVEKVAKRGRSRTRVPPRSGFAVGSKVKVGAGEQMLWELEV